MVDQSFITELQLTVMLKAWWCASYFSLITNSVLSVPKWTTETQDVKQTNKNVTTLAACSIHLARICRFWLSDLFIKIIF